VTTAGQRPNDCLAPIAWAVSRWWYDPFSRGAWSLLRVGASPETRRTLGQPVNERLIVVGEATHPEQAGMTHGAYEEGVRAAHWSLTQGHRNVVVIGAGMAGLAAARQLHDHGVNCIVVEARHRTGGRIHSTTVGGGGVATGAGGASEAGAGEGSTSVVGELGANWLQQGERNTLRPLAQQLGLRTIETNFHDPADFQVTDPGRRQDRPSPALLEMISAHMSELTATQDCSIQSVLAHWLNNPGPWDRSDIQRVVDAEIYLDSGAPLEDLSARFGFEPGVGEGDNWIVGGYGQLIDALATGSNGESRTEPLEILLETPVSTIRTYQTHVQIASNTGWATNADAAIVTAPIAVLKGGSITFQPPLPEHHQQALDLLTAGRVEKVVLQFAERFWPASPSNYLRIFGETDGCVSEWLAMTDTVGTPTITALLVGSWVEEIWTSPDGTPRDDHEIAQAVAAILQSTIQTSRW
jgi:polyamine oxidase